MNIKRLFFTVRFLRLIQWRYQVLYRLVKPRKLSHFRVRHLHNRPVPLAFTVPPPVNPSFLGNNTFVFLNQTKTFGSTINWNYLGYGKLWNYNLQYATYLLQDNLSFKEASALLKSLYSWLNSGQLPLEPYPVSLRSMHVIRWLSKHPTLDPDILKALYAELVFLSGRLEYHLLGNHLLEDGFALLMGGVFFNHSKWEMKAIKLLEKQLQEQVLTDGAHYGLSPSYHNVILFRLLEVLDWAGSLSREKEAFFLMIKAKASLLVSWIQQMRFRNGDLPHFNDSCNGMAFSTDWLMAFARKLKVIPADVPLGASGYRCVNRANYECRVDVAQLGPDYQPGHSHADALSLILYFRGQPLLVDRGTSTYQPGQVRIEERSTASHNTVVVNGMDQSHMWSQFRVAQRAHTSLLVDTDSKIIAQHNGYQSLGVIHRRTFLFEEDAITIVDELIGKTSVKGVFNLHFHPDREFSIGQDKILLGEGIAFSFTGLKCLSLEQFNLAVAFNKYRSSQKVMAEFEKKLITKITFPGK